MLYVMIPLVIRIPDRSGGGAGKRPAPGRKFLRSSLDKRMGGGHEALDLRVSSPRGRV